MLVIKPIQDKEVQREIVTQCGGTYAEAALAYAAYDCEENDSDAVRTTLGVCQFSLSGEAGVIDTLRPCPGIDDEEAMMIMARACTAFLYRCGFKTAVLLPNAAEAQLTAKLGFLPAEDGTASLDVLNYYTSPCHGEA